MPGGQGWWPSWDTVQPWVQGLLVPGAAGGWVLFKWRRLDRHQTAREAEAAREEANDFRLKDRAQIAADAALAFDRNKREIAECEARCAACEAEKQRAYAAFYDLYEWGRNNRHTLNGELGTLFLAWQAGKPAPASMPVVQSLPPREFFLKGSNENDR